ncbi:MAG: transposase [Planctomycetales bacterium]|nr:transposase [Planctomycetales bacterium]
MTLRVGNQFFATPQRAPPTVDVDHHPDCGMDEELKNEIVSRFHAGESMRSIARELRISRNTIRKVMDGNERARGNCRQRPSRVSTTCTSGILAPYDEELRYVLARVPNISVVRLLDRLREAGYQGSYTVLRERVKQLRCSSPSVESPEKRLHGPGSSAEVQIAALDLPHRRRILNQAVLFTMVLSHSGRVYARFSESGDFASTLNQHVRAFDYLGGVPRLIVYRDDSALLRTKADQTAAFREIFLGMATYYRFRPVIAQGPAAVSHLEIIRECLLPAPAFASIDHLNAYASEWLERGIAVNLNARSVEEATDDELRYLTPLPETPWNG